MLINKMMGSLIERHLNENTRSMAETQKALTDYNVMMGNLEDPNEEEETDERTQ